MLRWCAALAVLAASPIAHADFDPIGDDGWPKGSSVESLRALPRCDGPLRGDPGAEIPCRPAIPRGGNPISYSTDWTSGLALGDGTSGGSQAWGHELLAAVTRNWQLGGRYELIGTGLADDRRMAVTIENQLFAIARYRWFVDEVARSAWTLGGGVGWATNSGTPLARFAIGHDFGAYVTRKSALTSGLELAYERAFGDAAQHHVVGSLKLGFELGIREPKNLGEPAPRAMPVSLHVGVLAMPAVAFGFDASVGIGRKHLGLETSVGFLFGSDDQGKLTGLDGAQWSAFTGPRVTWWQVAYAQAQVGGAWVAEQDGGALEAQWHSELGISLGCVEAGVWARQDFAGERTVGGLLFRVGRGGGRSLCGGRAPEPRFAVEQLPPPVVVEAPEVVVEKSETVVEKSETVVERPVVVVEPPPVVVRVDPIVIDLDLALVRIGRALVLQLDPSSLPIARLRGGRVAIELSGPPRLLAGAEAQLRSVLGAAGIRVDAWARVAAGYSSGVRIRFTIIP